MTVFTAPPRAETCWTVPPPIGVNRMVSSSPHEPPRPRGASAMTSGSPPAMSIVRNLPVAKKPRCLPSGDQNGYDAFSVPDSDLASPVSSDRTHSVGDLVVAATNATLVPSGETITLPRFDPI